MLMKRREMGVLIILWKGFTQKVSIGMNSS